MRTLTFDFETSYKSNLPWIPGSYVVSLCIKDILGIQTYILNHSEVQTQADINDLKQEIQERFDKADIIIAHNLKFDLHWLRKLGIDFSRNKLYCTMVAEYCIEGQRQGLELSLASLSKKYNIPDKIDKVKEWWDSGYETYDIPLNILVPYGEQDVMNCEAVFHKQRFFISERKLDMLIRIRCESLRVTEEIEWNGMHLDVTLCQELSEDTGKQIEIITDSIKSKLKEVLPELIKCTINLNSNEHLSAILFGGKISYEGRVQGKREGTTKKGKLFVETNGVGFKPKEGTEAAKQGYYAVDKAQIAELKPKKGFQQEFVDAISTLSKLEKMKGTYYDGLMEKQIRGVVHPTINECRTSTGRYSSASPNLQNTPRSGTSDVKKIFITRYKE